MSFGTPDNWVSPDNFDIDKLTLEEHTSNSYTCMRVVFKGEGKKKKQFFLMGAGDREEGYMYTKGIKQDMITIKSKISATGKHSLPISIFRDNAYHTKFGDCIMAIVDMVKSKLGITDLSIPASMADDGSSMTVFAHLIESGPTIYSKFYTESENLDIKDVVKCNVRPLLIFSVTKTERTYKLRIQISECHVIFKKTIPFALARVE